MEKMQSCCAIQKNGNQCTIKVEGQTRCKRHALKTWGPNETKYSELGYIHQKEVRAIRLEFINGHIDHDQLRIRQRVETIRHNVALLAHQQEVQQQIIANEGIDPDQPFRQRRRELAAQRAQRVRQRWQDYLAQANAIRNNNIIGNANQNHVGHLAQFAGDKQNIHTEVVVRKVKETVEKILKVDVPLEYKTDTLKTLSEIIGDCKLSKQATLQMTSHYCNDHDIYDLGKGIYANVLNGVWQYIKSSENSEDLKRILKSELEDNIGMCAQGNLSRLCNILAGYMEEIDLRSLNEMISDKLSSLLEIEDIRERIVQARSFLDLHKVPRETWKEWLVPLMEDDDHHDIPAELLA
jgi:hypothetical protein